jgi:hypothetical protein
LRKRLDGHQMLAGCCGEEKNLFASKELTLPVIRPAGRTAVAVVSVMTGGAPTHSVIIYRAELITLREPGYLLLL